jgi:hypothetical protein
MTGRSDRTRAARPAAPGAEVSPRLRQPNDQTTAGISESVCLDAVRRHVDREGDAEKLIKEGIHRDRIWTARELADLLSCAGLRPHDVKAVALAKIELGGEVVEVRRR